MAEVKYESYTISSGNRANQIATGVIIKPHTTAGGVPEMQAKDFVSFQMNIDIDGAQSSNEGAIDFHILYIWSNSSKTSGDHKAKYYLNTAVAGTVTSSFATFGYTGRNQSASSFVGTGLSALTFPINENYWYNARTFYWTIVPYKISGTSASAMSRENNTGVTHVPAIWRLNSASSVSWSNFRWEGTGGQPVVSVKTQKKNDPSANNNVDRKYLYDEDMKQMFAYEFEERIVRTNGTGYGSVNTASTWTSGNKKSYDDNASGNGFRAGSTENKTITDYRRIESIVHSFWYDHTYSVKLIAKDRLGNQIHSVTKALSQNSVSYDDTVAYNHSTTLAAVNRVFNARPTITVQFGSTSSTAYAAYHRVEIRHGSHSNAIKQSFSINGFDSSGNLLNFGTSRVGTVELNAQSIPDLDQDKTLYVTVRSKTNTHSPLVSSNSGGDIDSHQFTVTYDAQTWDDWHSSTDQEIVKYSATELDIKVSPKATATNAGRRAWGFQIQRITNLVHYNNPDNYVYDPGWIIFDGLDHSESKYITTTHSGNPIDIISIMEGNEQLSNKSGYSYRSSENIEFAYRGRASSGSYLGPVSHAEVLTVPTQPQADITSLAIATTSGNEKYNNTGGGVISIGYKIRGHKTLRDIDDFPTKVKVKAGYYNSGGSFTYQTSWEQIITITSSYSSSASATTQEKTGTISIDIDDFDRAFHHSSHQNKIGVVLIPLDTNTTPGEYDYGTSDTTYITVKDVFQWRSDALCQHLTNTAGELKVRAGLLDRASNSQFEPASVRFHVNNTHGVLDTNQITVPFQTVINNGGSMDFTSIAGIDTDSLRHSMVTVDNIATGSVLSSDDLFNLRRFNGSISVTALDYDNNSIASISVTPPVSEQNATVLHTQFGEYYWRLFLDSDEQNIGYIKVLFNEFSAAQKTWFVSASKIGLQIQEAELNYYTSHDNGFKPHISGDNTTAGAHNTLAGNIVLDQWLTLSDIESGDVAIRLARKFLGPTELTANLWRNFRARVKFYFPRSGKTYYGSWGNLWHLWKLNRHSQPASGSDQDYFVHVPHVDGSFNAANGTMRNGKISINLNGSDKNANTSLTFPMTGYTLSGKVVETVQGSVINSDGTFVTSGGGAGKHETKSRSNRVDNIKTTLLNDSDFGTIFGINGLSGTNGIDYTPELTDEAMYRSEIKLEVERSCNNKSRTTSGSGNAEDDTTAITDYNNNLSSNILKYPSSGWSLKSVSNTLTKTLTLIKGDVYMNDVQVSNNMLKPQDALTSFTQRTNGLAQLSGRTVEIGLGFDINDYFKNSNPKIAVGLRLMHHNWDTNYTNPHAATQKFVCFKPVDATKFEESHGGINRANGDPLGWDSNVINVSDLETLRSNIIFDLRQHIVDYNNKTGSADNSKYSIPIELTFSHSMYGYQNDKFDASKNISMLLYVYTEEELTLTAKYGDAHRIPSSPTQGDGTVSQSNLLNPGTWLGKNVETINLQTTTSAYGHLEGSVDGEIDSSHATFNSWTLEENSSTKTVVDAKLDFTNLNNKKKPWYASVDKVKYSFAGRHTGADLGLDANAHANPNTTVSFGSTVKPKQLDTANYVAEEDVIFIMDPTVTSKTDFGAGGVVYSKYLTFPASNISSAQRTLTKNYKEDFVPDFTNLAFTSGAEIVDITPAGQENTPSLRISFDYNSTAFTDAEDYFQVAHENIKIMRTLEQSGTEFPTSNDSWSQVYNGNIFDIANKTDNGDGTHTFVIDDNLIDVSVIGGTFNPANTFKYKYRIFPSLNYTPGGAGATAKTVDRTLSPQVSATMDSTGPLNLFDPVSIESVSYLDKHSVEVHWKYIHNETLNTLKGFNDSADRTVNVKFKVYYKAADERDFVYRNNVKETRPDNFERAIPKVKKEKDKFDSMRSSWIYSGFKQFDLNNDSEQKFYHNIEYNKVSFEYGIKVAILVVAEDSNNAPEVLDLSHDITSVTNLKGINTYGMSQFEETGLLVGPPEHLKIKKKFSDIELTGTKDIVARRKYEYDMLVNNIHQIPFSVTRKRAKTRLSDKPYTSNT